MSGYYQHYLTTGGVCYNPDPADDPTTEHQHKPNRDPANRLPTCGNDQTMNLNPLLFQNIIASQYFKALYEKKTFHEVVDEIYEHVDNLEPFLKGTTASTAFCLLYKLWTLKLSVKQVKNLITHLDSPHIRALGFLYLRYVLKPELLYEWFEGHLEDSEEIQVTKGPRPVIVTMGKLLRDLLMEQKFLGTMLPRIPVPIEREMRKKLAEEYISLCVLGRRTVWVGGNMLPGGYEHQD